MRVRGFRLLGGVALVAVLAVVGDLMGVASATRTPERAPSKYRGTWVGETAQGYEVFLKVNRQGRIRVLEFGYEVQGEGCSAEVEKDVRGAVAPIKRKRFKASGETSGDSYRLTGRFTSARAARGKLTGSVEGDCSGTTATTWRAKKGKRPPVDRTYDGSWDGSVSLPGVDTDLLDAAGGLFFVIEDGAVTTAGVPAIVQGQSCRSIRLPTLGTVLDPPVRVVKRQFSASWSDSIGGSWSFSLDAAFQSASSASGTVTVSGSVFQGFPFFGFCTGTLEGTWEATKLAKGGR